MTAQTSILLIPDLKFKPVLKCYSYMSHYIKKYNALPTRYPMLNIALV